MNWKNRSRDALKLLPTYQPPQGLFIKHAPTKIRA